MALAAHRRHFSLWRVGLLVAALGAAALATQSHGGTPRIPQGAIRVDVSASPFGRSVKPGFLGLSIEYPSSIAYSGADPYRPNPVYLQLVRNFTPGQAPVIRFGGDTTDWTWWPVPGLAKPGGIRYTLTRRWIGVARATAAALGARLILGINLEADSAKVAGSEARRLLDGIGRRHIAGFELGNEPEVYGQLPWYTIPAGVAVAGRPRSYGFADYLRDYANVSAALPRGVPLVGPASGAPPWLDGLSRYLRANPRVRTATFHRYPLHRCANPRTSPTYPTIANLLAPVASSGPATSLQRAVMAAHAQGIPFRSDELNSVSCGGARGVSDTFASALWVLDTLFNMARVGVDGVNIHTFRTGVYAPFAFASAQRHWSARVNPMYYGMLLFARAAPPGARLLHVRLHGPRTLRVWATRSPSGRRAVLAINDSPRRRATLAVRLAGATSAVLERLRAPALQARHGISLAGQSFGLRTVTGRLAGGLQSSVLNLVQGRFVLRVPAGSAALLTIRGG